MAATVREELQEVEDELFTGKRTDSARTTPSRRRRPGQQGATARPTAEERCSRRRSRSPSSRSGATAHKSRRSRSRPLRDPSADRRHAATRSVRGVNGGRPHARRCASRLHALRLRRRSSSAPPCVALLLEPPPRAAGRLRRRTAPLWEYRGMPLRLSNVSQSGGPSLSCYCLRRRICRRRKGDRQPCSRNAARRPPEVFVDEEGATSPNDGRHLGVAFGHASPSGCRQAPGAGGSGASAPRSHVGCRARFHTQAFLSSVPELLVSCARNCLRCVDARLVDGVRRKRSIAITYSSSPPELAVGIEAHRRDAPTSSASTSILLAVAAISRADADEVADRRAA